MSVQTDNYHKLDQVEDYFALRPSSECVNICRDLIDAYYLQMLRSGRTNLYKMSFYKYNESFFARGALSKQGMQGELQGVTVNNYRNFINHMLTMACQQRLSYEPQTSDSSHEALEQVRLAKGLLNLYSARSDIDLDGVLRRATEICLVYGESFVAALWDQTKGKTVAMDSESESLVPEGDIELKIYDPFSIVRDVYISTSDNEEWIILREEVNKVNLAVEFPQFERDIMSETISGDYKNRDAYPCFNPTSNIVHCWTLYHKRTIAVPNGRMLKFINDKVILSDGPLPEEYEDIPVHRMAASDLLGSCWGYSKTFDSLPLCDAITRLHASVLTNNLTFGTQSILAPRDCNFSASTFGQNLTLVTYDAKNGAAYKPEALNLTKSAPETYQYINTLTQTAGTLMGINEVTRGNPDLVLKGQQSGAALALMATQSIQFNSDLGKAYESLAERIGAGQTLLWGGFLCIIAAIIFTLQLPRLRKFVRVEYIKKGIIAQPVG